MKKYGRLRSINYIYFNGVGEYTRPDLNAVFTMCAADLTRPSSFERDFFFFFFYFLFWRHVGVTCNTYAMDARISAVEGIPKLGSFGRRIPD